MRIGIVILSGILLALFLFFRFRYIGNDPITSKDFTISGITNSVGIICGENYESVIITVPDFIDPDDIISVSSRPDVAYLEFDTGELTDGRILKAKIITLSPGIAELSVRTVDGDLMSEKYTVNIVGNSEAVLSEKIPVSTSCIEPEDGEVLITPSGKRYHLRKTCAGDTSYAVSLSEAVDLGYTPCKLCALAE